jgi:hypothetical protein
MQQFALTTQGNAMMVNAYANAAEKLLDKGPDAVIKCKNAFTTTSELGRLKSLYERLKAMCESTWGAYRVEAFIHSRGGEPNDEAGYRFLINQLAPYCGYQGVV